MESIEHAVEAILAGMISRGLDEGDTIPVLRSDETVETDEFAAIVVEANRKDAAPAVDEDDYLAGPIILEVAVTYRTLAPKESADKSTESARWNSIEESLRSTDATGLDLDRFLDFFVMPGSSSDQGQEGDRKTKTRTYRVAVIEDRSPEEELPGD